MGMFSGLAGEAYDRQYSDRQLAARILKYLRPRVRDTRLVLLGIGLLTIIGLADPIIVSRTLDLLRAIAAGTDTTDKTVLVTGLITALFAFSLLVWLFNILRRRAMARLVAEMIAELRRDAFNAVIRHDLSFFDKYQSGKIISRISNDTQELAAVAGLITDLATQFTTLVFLVVILLGISVPMTLSLVLMAPIIAVAAALFRRLARTVTRNGFRAIADVNSAIQEAVAGMRVAKNFRQEAALYAGFNTVNRRSYVVNVRRGLVLSNIFPTLNMLTGLGTAIMLYLGALNISTFGLTLGGLYLFLTSLDRFWFPMTNLAAFYSQIQSGFSACERIFALIDAESNVAQLPETTKRRIERGAINFDDLSFRYNTQQQVLDHFSLDIAPGERGLCRPYRSGQEQHRQAHRPLLRIPERAFAHRRA